MSGLTWTEHDEAAADEQARYWATSSAEYDSRSIYAAIRAAVLAERERCASIVERPAVLVMPTPREIATAIRGGKESA